MNILPINNLNNKYNQQINSLINLTLSLNRTFLMILIEL